MSAAIPHPSARPVRAAPRPLRALSAGLLVASLTVGAAFVAAGGAVAPGGWAIGTLQPHELRQRMELAGFRIGQPGPPLLLASAAQEQERYVIELAFGVQPVRVVLRSFSSGAAARRAAQRPDVQAPFGAGTSCQAVAGRSHVAVSAPSEGLCRAALAALEEL